MSTLNRFLLFLVSSSCFHFTAHTQMPCHPDYDVLIELYNLTDGANWTNNAGWTNGAAGTDCDLCNWHGIECEMGRVTVINMHNNNLVGTIPASLADVAMLEQLRLEKNMLTGTIPAGLGNLPNLNYIYMGKNMLSGTIPPEFGNLSNLTTLLLGGNNLQGGIPPEFGNLSNLVNLTLSKNQLSGSIPPELGALSNLEFLLLTDNQLTGKIPSTIGDMSNLIFLSLDKNMLSGTIPPELGDLLNLGVLNLSDNQLEGCFPSGLSYHCFPGNTFSSNPDLPGGGDFNAFCMNGTGACAIELDLKMVLGGAYDNNTGIMRTDLKQTNTLPMNLGSNSITEAYLLDTTGSDAIVDWVTVEVREVNTSSTIAAQQNALLQSDGDIVDADGRGLVIFDTLPAGDYHVAIRHRNHLGVMSMTTVTVN